MSTHAIRAIIPVEIVRFSRFITIHVENYFGAASNISYLSLLRGKAMDPWF